MPDIRIVPGNAIMSFTSSLNYIERITQDPSGSLTLYGSGSTGRTDLFSIDGNNGRLFSVSDDLSDSLFSVNTIAGLPVIEAFANNTVVLGQYGKNVLVVTGSRVGFGTAFPTEQVHIATGSLLFTTSSANSVDVRLAPGGGTSNIDQYLDIFIGNGSTTPFVRIGQNPFDVTEESTGLFVTGKVSFKAAPAGTAATQILVTSADPASTGRIIKTRTPAQLRSDIGAGVGSVTSVGGTGTVNGITLTGTVTSTGNLTLGGTLGSIGNSQLTNSSITVGSTAISLGSSATTIAGLSSVTSTSFTGSLLGTASAVSSITNNTGLLRDRLAASAVIDSLTSSNFRTTLFGSSTNGYQTSTARWNNVPTPLSGLNQYGTMFAWAGSDTHGFLAVDYTAAGAIVGGGNADLINWSKKLAFADGTGASGTWGIGISGNAGSVTYSPNRNDAAAYPVLWGAAYTNSIGTIAYSAAAVTIQSSTGTLNATNLAATTRMDAPIYYDSNSTNYYSNPASTSALYDVTVINSITAPIYYDYNNTAYYVNPASTSILQNITANGEIRSPIYYESSNTAYYFDGGNTGDSIRAAGDIVAYYSDERLKDRKGNIENALEKVLSLNGFYYEPNERAQELGYKKKPEVGVSAQEVEAILPEIVKDAAIGYGYKTLDYSKLVPLLIEAIKEQQKQIDELKSIK